MFELTWASSIFKMAFPGPKLIIGQKVLGRKYDNLGLGIGVLGLGLDQILDIKI